VTGPHLVPPSPEQPFGPVIITAREIYDAVVRVSAKVDIVSAQMTQLVADGQDWEARIRALERGRWPLPSLAVLLSIAGLVFTVLTH
jgi:hypothetical protein